MLNENQNKRDNETEEMDSIDYIDMVSSPAASAGDMTGLIPAAPLKGHNYDAYNALYSHDTITRRNGWKKKFDR